MYSKDSNKNVMVGITKEEYFFYLFSTVLQRKYFFYYNSDIQMNPTALYSISKSH